MSLGRRVASLALVAVLAGGLGAALPATPAVAVSLPAPVLVSPVGATVADVVVDFSWQRVPGAVAYQLRVRHDSTSGPETLAVTTVNDRHVAVVNLAGDRAYWEVAAVAGNGTVGAVASATFTTARLGPTLSWPPDGVTITHPDAWPDLAASIPPGDPSSIRTAPGAGDEVPEAGLTNRFTIGTWRWGTRGDRPSNDSVSDPPTVGPRTFTMAWRGATPTLTSPADRAALGPAESLRLRWEPVPGAAAYQTEILPIGGDQPVTWSTATATWADVVTDWRADGLRGGTWEWRVRAIMSNTEDVPSNGGSPVMGPWSSRFRFTLPTTLPEPVLTFPPDGASLDTWPLLRWDPVPGARSHIVELSDHPGPTDDPWNTRRGGGPGWFSFAAPGADAPLVSAAQGTSTRYWRVHAGVTLYDADVWVTSPWRSFTVTTGIALGDPVAATLLGPPDCSSEACDLPGRPLLSWEPVAGAASYRVFLRRDGGAGPADAWFDIGSPALLLPASAATDPIDRAAWNVVACSDSGCPEAMPAERRRFRVVFEPPVQEGPGDGTVQAGPPVEMSWRPPARVAGGPEIAWPTDAEVEWRMTPGEFGEPTSLYRQWTRFSIHTHYLVPDGAEITWRVRYCELRGSSFDRVCGSWSPSRLIARAAPDVELVGPTDGAIIDAAPLLDWSELPYSVRGYTVHLAKETTLARWGSDAVDWGRTTGATSIRLPDLAPGRYRWRVTDASTWNWTTGWFTMAGDPRPQVVGPAPGATVRADDAFFEWEPYPSHEWYADRRVQLSTTPAFEEADIVRSWSVERTATAFAAPEELPVGDVYWRVCATWDCSLPTPIDPEAGDAEPEALAPAATAADGAAVSTPRLLHVIAAPGPDTTPPEIAALAVAPIVGRQLATNGATPVRFTWRATDVGSGVAAQAVQLRRGSGSWVSIPVSATARSAAAWLLPDATYTIRVRATDASGNATGWAKRRVEAMLRQESSSLWSWSGTWTRSYTSSALGRYKRWSTRAGASATIRVTASAVGLVAPRSSTRGSARIYVDGKLAATIRLDAQPTGARRLAWTASWPSSGSHRVTVKVVGTAGHPRVDLDAIIILR